MLGAGGSGAREVLLLPGLSAVRRLSDWLPSQPREPWLPGELAMAALEGLIERTYCLNGSEACFLEKCLAAVLGIEA